jgi:hypothetical protein
MDYWRIPGFTAKRIEEKHMKTEIYKCDMLLPDSRKECGKKAAMRRMHSGEQSEYPISIGVGNCFYYVCESCAKLPLTELLKRIVDLVGKTKNK